MRHRDAVRMLAGARLDAAPGTWADLGCGDGAFTLALAALLAPASLIHALDRDGAALRQMRASSRVHIERHAVDFTQAWPFDAVLDGILMANSLHYVAEQEVFLARCFGRLSPSGQVLVVEYDTDASNRWVPYPLSFGSLSGLLGRVGFTRVERLASRRSRYQRAALYAASASREADASASHGRGGG